MASVRTEEAEMTVTSKVGGGSAPVITCIQPASTTFWDNYYNVIIGKLSVPC